MNPGDGVAQRIAQLRKLAGWTQHQLAARAFVSTSLVKKVEQGRTPPSPAFVASCARALGIEPSTLYRHTRDEFAFEPEIERSNINELRIALHSYDNPNATEPLWSASYLQTQLNRLDYLRNWFRYNEMSLILPEVLHQLFVHCNATRSETSPGEQWRAMLHDAYRLAATLGGRLGQQDISFIAHERHLMLAPYTGDPLRGAISQFHRSTYFLQHGDFSRGLDVLDKAQEVAQSSTSKHKYSVSIQLHLRAAIFAARSGDKEMADEHINHAEEISREFAPNSSPYFNINASTLNINVHWCALPVEYYDGTKSITRSERVSIEDRTQPERIGHHHIDMARAWLLHGKNRERVIAELRAAREVAPHHTRNHPTVHETIRSLAESDHRSTDTLAGFARWAGVDI